MLINSWKAGYNYVCDPYEVTHNPYELRVSCWVAHIFPRICNSILTPGCRPWLNLVDVHVSRLNCRLLTRSGGTSSRKPLSFSTRCSWCWKRRTTKSRCSTCGITRSCFRIFTTPSWPGLAGKVSVELPGRNSVKLLQFRGNGHIFCSSYHCPNHQFVHVCVLVQLGILIADAS